MSTRTVSAALIPATMAFIGGASDVVKSRIAESR